MEFWVVTDRLATMPEATAKTAGSSTANVGDTGGTPESWAVKPVAPEEQTMPPRRRRAYSDPLSGHGAPWWCLQSRRKRTRWKRLNMRNLDPSYPNPP